MMICSDCQTGQFLQITSSKIKFTEDNADVFYCAERYQCTLCGNTGMMYGSVDQDVPAEITGSVAFRYEKDVPEVLWP